jgi:hypothetical protein
MHLKQVCDIHTKQTVWTDGKHLMHTVDWAKHARKDAVIEYVDTVLAQ